ncbi:prenyltransferase/squalene oxidase repeat-containing protein [Prosthecobacter fusiformis]|nr:prenyltransferase/squalene oxidase repeat-containing protein [Prosthecobacter fusiformis]
MDPKKPHSDPSAPGGPPPPSGLSATQPLGPPPGATGNLGYPVQGNLGYPVQPNLGYPMQPGMVPPSAASGPVPVAAVEEEEEFMAVEAVGGEVFHPPALNHFEPARPSNPLIQAWRKVGGGSLALSIAIHVGILVVGGAIVVSTQMIQKQVDFLPGGGTQQGAEASAEMQHKVQQKKRTTLNKSMPMKKIVSTSQNSAVTLPDAPPDFLDVPDVGAMLGGGSLSGAGFGKAGAGSGFGTGMGMGSMQGFVSLPPSMRSRCSPQERLKKLAETGGSAECERAVSASLEWLKGQQNEDGSWGRSGGKRDKAAMTGLALLCYLGRCETPDSPFYGDNVMKGILYLVELSKKNPHGMIAEDIFNNGSTYEHGIATYALGEMYTLARLGSKELPGMRAAFEKGVKLIIDNQNTRGSWTYGGKEAGMTTAYTKDSKGEDLSVAGWQFQALKAAKNSGLKIQGLDAAIKKCTEYVLSKQTKDGGFGKTNRDDHYNQWSLTGAGSLALQTMSKGNTAALKKAMGFLRGFLEAEPLDWNKNCNLYCWYYYTQTFFQAGGDDWKFYNQQFLPQILAAQQPDGSFKKGRPNWPAGDAADPLYRQTLCTLQLEVYYRYLKVADRDEQSFFDR